MRRPLLPAICCLLLTSMVACAQAGAPLPESPRETATPPVVPPVAQGVLGMYQMSMTESGGLPEVSLTPWRDLQAVGDSYLLDASAYFSGALCGDCVRLSGIRLVDTTTLDLDFTLRHPFPLPAASPAPKDRLDLHIFDVTGILVSAEPGGPLFPASQTRIAPVRLLNPHGYTGVLDPWLDRIFPTPQADAHPYRVFAIDDTAGNFAGGNPSGFADLATPRGFNVFPQGSVATQTYRLRMPPAGTSLRFNQDALLVISASWGQGAGSKPERMTPVYRAPEFNQKAPWSVTANVTANTLTGGQTSSSATLGVTIRDWQWDVPLAATWPDPGSRGTIRTASNPVQVLVEVPGITNGAVSVDPTTFPGTGQTRTGQIDITNALAAAEGTYLGLVQVIDNHDNALGIAQDDPTPGFLGQLRTSAVFAVTVAPGGGPGPFGSAVLISDRDLNDIAGLFNTNMPELVTDGSDLYLGYQGPADEAVVARCTNFGSSWTNVEVYQGSPGAFLDPSIGCVANSDDLQVVLAAPDDTGTYSSRSQNNGSSWSPLLEVHDDLGSPDDSQAITSGIGAPVAIFGTIRESGGTLEFVLGSAVFTGTLWSERSLITDARPGSGPGLIRIDESPMIYRLSDNSLVCLFSSNERPITTLGDDTISEPVVARSLDEGATWQDWTYVRSLDGTRTIETLASARQGDTLYFVEVAEDGTPSLRRSTNGGLAWLSRPLPTELTSVENGICEIAAGPDQTLALIWASGDGGNATLICSLSDNGGDTWGTVLPCEDDPGNLYTVYAASAVFTTNGRLHIAFTSNRRPGGQIGWYSVSQQP